MRDGILALGMGVLATVVTACGGGGGGEARTTVAPGTGQSTGIVVAAPTTLIATAASATQIQLAWTDNAPDEDGYSVVRRTGGGTFAEVAVVGANVSSLTLGGHAPATVYDFQVRAFKGVTSSTPSNVASAQTPSATQAWETMVNGSANDADEAQDVVVTTDGIYIAGAKTSAQGGRDLYAAKLDPADGTVLWEQSVDGPANGDEWAFGIAVVGDAVYVTGSLDDGVEPDLWVGRLSATDGAIQWQQTVPAQTASLGRVVVADASGVYVAGSIAQAAVLPGQTAPPHGVVARRFAPDTGTLVWEQIISGAVGGGDVAWSMTLASDGLYLGGSLGNTQAFDGWVGKLDLANGDVLWESPLGPTAVGGLVLGLSLNATSVFATGGSFFSAQFVAALDRQTGALTWETTLPGSGLDLFDYQLGGRRLVASSDTRVFVVGHKVNDSAVVASLDATSGGIDWETTFASAGSGTNRPHGLALDAATGALFVTGQKSVTSDDAWVARLQTGSGAVAWEDTFDGSANGGDRGRALGVSATSVYVVGQLSAAGTDGDVWVKQLAK